MSAGIDIKLPGNALILIAFFSLCVFSALAISVGFYGFLMLPVAVVLAVIFAIYLVGGVDKKFPRLFLISGFFYVIASILWPRYVAIWLPGLPSLNLPRIAGIIYLLLIFVGFFVSKWFREIVGQSIRNFSMFWIALLFFLIFRFVSVFSSADIGSALYQFVNETVVHVSLIFFGVSLGAKDYLLSRRIFAAISFAFFVCFAIGMVEWLTGKNIFSKFIDPSNNYALWAVSEKARSGSYRAQSTFGHPLTFAEFSAASVCLVLSTVSFVKNIGYRFVLYVISVCAAGGMVFLAGSRAGYGAVVIVCSLMLIAPLLVSITHKQLSLIAAVYWSFVVIVISVIFSVAILFVYDHAFGNRSEVKSNNARLLMYERGFLKALDSPLTGFGVGQAADLVGTPSGTGVSKYTVDSLYVSYVVESGYGALAAFVFILISSIVRVFRAAFFGDYKNWLFWFSIGVALVSCFVFKFILSLIDNNYLFFMLIGITVSVICKDSYSKVKSCT